MFTTMDTLDSKRCPEHFRQQEVLFHSKCFSGSQEGYDFAPYYASQLMLVAHRVKESTPGADTFRCTRRDSTLEEIKDSAAAVVCRSADS